MLCELDSIQYANLFQLNLILPKPSKDEKSHSNATNFSLAGLIVLFQYQTTDKRDLHYWYR